jgi:hypothetical protein
MIDECPWSDGEDTPSPESSPAPRDTHIILYGSPRYPYQTSESRYRGEAKLPLLTSPPYLKGALAYRIAGTPWGAGENEREGALNPGGDLNRETLEYNSSGLQYK